MTYLFDVNALLALGDLKHPSHFKVAKWKDSNPGIGWATCPITENGFVRIISQPSYKNTNLNAAEALLALQKICTDPFHEFWPDEISIRENLPCDKVPGPKAVTDLYLLALAVHKNGKLASLDTRIDPTLIPGGQEAFHLIG